jgi:tetratricopeptide (TPR) repeat protein
VSRTADSAEDRKAGQNTAYLELSRMMRQGRSWSGRERNCLFLNTRGPRFANVSASSGFDFLDDARAVALSDWDQDGDLDLWVSNRNGPRLRLLRNEWPRASPATSPRFLALALEGNGTTTNRDAVGARVEVHVAGGEVHRRTLRAGEGFLAQSSAWLHVGLGGAQGIDKVVVRWPGGGVEELRGLELDSRYRLVQGSGKAIPWRRPGTATALAPSEQEALAPTAAARVPLVTLLGVPGVSYARFDGSGASLPVGRGEAGARPLLINVFASWCEPCAAELAEITARAEDLRRAGIDVLALATDGLGADRSDPREAARLLERLRFPFSSGRATEGLLRMLQRLHDAHIALQRPLPLPSSFLVDRAGRLAVLYKGRVAVDTVLADIEHGGRSRIERWRRAAALPGSAIEHERMERTTDTVEAAARFLFALDVAAAGRRDDARREYLEVLALKPDFAEAHNNLGNLALQSGDLAAAESSLRRALAVRADAAEPWFNLGRILEARGDLAGAEAHYRRALSLRADYPGAHNAIGLLLARRGQLAEAIAELEREIALNPRLAEAHVNLGVARLQSRDDVGAEACFLAALGLDPRYVEALNNLGAIYLERGDRERAAAQFRRALAVDPEFEPARRNLERLRAGR